MKHRSCQRWPFDLWVGHNVESPSIKSYLEPVIIACRYRSWLFYWDLTFYWSFAVGWPSCTSVYAQLGCCPNICIISLVFTWDAFKPKCVPLLFRRPPDLILIYISTEEERWSRGRISWGGDLCCLWGEGELTSCWAEGSVLQCWLCLCSHESGWWGLFRGSNTVADEHFCSAQTDFPMAAIRLVPLFIFSFLMFSCWGGLNVRVTIIVLIYSDLIF